MAKKGGAKPKDKKGSGEKQRHPSQRYKLYEISGTEVKRKNKFCPRRNFFFGNLSISITRHVDHIDPTTKIKIV